VHVTPDQRRGWWSAVRRIDEHLAHELLLAFVNREHEIDPVRLGGGLRTPFKRWRAGNALEVLGQNGIASTATLNSLKGCPSVELSFVEKAGLIELGHAIDLHVIDQILRAFLNVQEDGDGVELAAFRHPSGARSLWTSAETVGLVEVGDGFLIAAQQALAIAAVRKLEKGGGLQVHSLADHLGGEVAIAGDGDGHQFVLLARCSPENPRWLCR